MREIPAGEGCGPGACRKLCKVTPVLLHGIVSPEARGRRMRHERGAGRDSRGRRWQRGRERERESERERGREGERKEGREREREGERESERSRERANENHTEQERGVDLVRVASCVKSLRSSYTGLYP